MKKFLNRIGAMLMLVAISMPTWALEPNSDGVYEIGTAADLKAFAVLVNGGNKTASAVLTADIVADADQPMIGTGSSYSNNNGWAGSFDGQNHTITLNWTGDNALTADDRRFFSPLTYFAASFLA